MQGCPDLAAPGCWYYPGSSPELVGLGLAPATVTLRSYFPKQHQVLCSNSLLLAPVTLWADQGTYIDRHYLQRIEIRMIENGIC